MNHGNGMLSEKGKSVKSSNARDRPRRQTQNSAKSTISNTYALSILHHHLASSSRTSPHFPVGTQTGVYRTANPFNSEASSDISADLFPFRAQITTTNRILWVIQHLNTHTQQCRSQQAFSAMPVSDSSHDAMRSDCRSETSLRVSSRLPRPHAQPSSTFLFAHVGVETCITNLFFLCLLQF